VVVEHVGQQDGVPALGGRTAEAGPVEVAANVGHLGMAFAEDRLDLGRVEHGGLQPGSGPGQGGGVGAGTAADVEQPPRPRQAGQGGQLASEPGRQVVESAEEVEEAASISGGRSGSSPRRMLAKARSRSPVVLAESMNASETLPRPTWIRPASAASHGGTASASTSSSSSRRASREETTARVAVTRSPPACTATARSPATSTLVTAMPQRSLPPPPPARPRPAWPWPDSRRRPGRCARPR
jgi:hypothetical protein